MLSMVAERIFNLFMERIGTRHTVGEGLEPIAATLRHIVQRTTEKQVPSRALPVIIGAALVNPGLAKSVKTLNDAGIKWVADVLRSGVNEGSIRADINPYAEAAAITAFHRGCTMYYMVDPTFPMHKVTETFIAELQTRLRTNVRHLRSKAAKKSVKRQG